MAKEAMKLVANNKKAYHDFFIEEKYETGLAPSVTFSSKTGRIMFKRDLFRKGHTSRISFTASRRSAINGTG